VDQHRRGRIQLEEAVEMIDRAHDGVEEEQKVVFVLSMFLYSPSLTDTV
jgi:L-rhamnono-1,4-lactonase